MKLCIVYHLQNKVVTSVSDDITWMHEKNKAQQVFALEMSHELFSRNNRFAQTRSFLSVKGNF